MIKATGNSVVIDWSVGHKVFKGHHNGNKDDRYITLKDGRADLSGYSKPGKVTVSWDQWEEGNLEPEDCLYLIYDGDGDLTDGGEKWEVAFCGDDPIGHVTIPISDEHWTEDFTMGFYLDGFAEKGSKGKGTEYCYIDNIVIQYESDGGTGLYEADISVIFAIDDEQVYFDKKGLPKKGFDEIVADEVQILPNYDGDGDPHGFSYSCSKDVTALLQEFSAVGDVEKGNHPGNGTYTVGGVNADTGDEWSYAGWSLIIIYESPDTEGRQLYLYDDFIYSDMRTNMDFDNDGSPGGTITGFIIPDPIEGETNAARLTCFVGEGDDHYDGDYLYFNAYGLSNAASPIDNVWNSKSSDLFVDGQDGVDIDTFNISWASKVLLPGNSSVKVDLNTGVDSWNLVYIILSVRSETTTGGALDYLLEF